MFILLAVIIVVSFTSFLILFVRFKIRSILNKAGFANMNLADVIREARLEDQELPKSLSSMDSVYLTRIKQDFPDLNINELKAKTEKTILDIYNCIENKNSSGLKGKLKSFTDEIINDYKNNNVKYNNFKIHNTVVSKYRNDKGIATIEFGCSYEYILVVDGKSTKVQDRSKLEFIYVIDIDKVSADKSVLGINCPNCGAPVKKLGDLYCIYCGTGLKNIYRHSFTCNNIVRY